MRLDTPLVETTGRRLLSALAVISAGVFIACVAVRLPFDFELAWMESGMQAMTDRLAAHQSIYAAPSPAYVPFLYPPLYYLAAHALATVAPRLAGAAAMRAVSAASTLGVALLIGVVAARRGAGPRARWWLPALFLAFYGRFDFWFDTSRVDTLLTLLLFGAVALAIEGRAWRSAIAAGVVGGLAVLTKQPAAPILGGALAAVVAFGGSWRRAAATALTTAATVTAALAALGELGNPWLYFYLFEVPGSHPLTAQHLADSAAFLALTMPVLIGCAVAAVRRGGDAPPRPAPERDRTWAAVFLIAALVLTGLRLKQGTASNFFIPLVPIGLAVVAGRVARFGARVQPWLILQFVILAYDPSRAIPTSRDWNAGFQLIHELRAIPGDVFLPQFPGYLTMAGKRTVAHDVAVCDLAALRPDVLAAIDRQLRAGDYRAAAHSPEAAPDPRCHAYVPPELLGATAPTPAGGALFDRQHGEHLAGISLLRGPPAPPGS
jgi:hypothetical protein